MSNATAAGDISQFKFPGGFPSSADLAPSVIFLVVYVLTVPVMVWRLIKPESRSKVLIRPTIFLVFQVAGLVLRAVMAKTSYGEGELIAELILVSIGVLFLIDPILSLWERHVDSALSRDDRPKWVTRLTRLLRLTLAAAIITTIIGSSKISGAINDPAQIASVLSLRKAASILTLVVVVVAVFAVIATTVSLGLDPRRAGLIIAIALPLIVVSAYRLVQVYSTDASSAVRQPWAFWVLQILFELIAYCIIISFPINTFFPVAAVVEDVKNGASPV